MSEADVSDRQLGYSSSMHEGHNNGMMMGMSVDAAGASDYDGYKSS